MIGFTWFHQNLEWFHTRWYKVTGWWQALAPLRFHLLRHLAFGNDAVFCQMLRRCEPHLTTGGKSKSAFWKSQCGQLMLKEVRAAEASHLASKAGPFAVRLAEALRGEPSLLCEVFGLFKVSRLGKRPQTRTIIIMRNLLNGITDDWQIFDIKGAAHRNMPPIETDGPPTSPTAVKWDGGFVETFGALPKVLKPSDHEALELALKCDLHVLRQLGLVDYSLLMAFHLKDHRVRLAIIDFLQPYTLNKQQLWQQTIGFFECFFGFRLPTWGATGGWVLGWSPPWRNWCSGMSPPLWSRWSGTFGAKNRGRWRFDIDDQIVLWFVDICAWRTGKPKTDAFDPAFIAFVNR